MNGYNSIDEIEEECKKGKIDRLQAIEALQEEFNYTSLDAESTVDSWID